LTGISEKLLDGKVSRVHLLNDPHLRRNDPLRIAKCTVHIQNDTQFRKKEFNDETAGVIEIY
jgi:hypothetical protein